MRNILIVEPHFDDAWINLGGYILLHPSDYFLILTVTEYPSNRRNGSAELKRFLPHIDGHALGYRSLGFEDPYVRRLERRFGETNHRRLFGRMNAPDTMASIRRTIRPFGSGMDRIFWPLGLKHPQHVLMERLNPFRQCSYYREFPYFAYPDQRVVLREKTTGWKRRRVDIAPVMHRKRELFELAYQKQAFIYDLNVGGVRLADLDNECYWDQG